MKGRVIKYKPVAKLRGKSGAKKGGMRGGGNKFKIYYVGTKENGYNSNPGIIIEDIKEERKYFFENTKQEFALHIYYLVTKKDLDDVSKNFEVKDEDYSNIIRKLQTNASQII